MATRAPGTQSRWLAITNRWFEIGDRGAAHRTEILGGLTTFLTMVYIVFVNPAVLSATADTRSRSPPGSA
jgi:AGZA family xanthine/uracil permease-like MFS transporter